MSLIVHYPLNGLDLDFDRYEHRPLGPREIMVNRIMEDFMAPKRVKAGVYNKTGVYREPWLQIKALDKRLGLDVQVLLKLLRTHFDWPPRFTLTKELSTFLSMIFIWPSVPPTRSDLASAILGMIERHYLECHPSLRIILRCFQSRSSMDGPTHEPGWKKDVIEHLKGFQQAKETQYLHHLYSRGHYVPTGPVGAQLSVVPCFIVACKSNFKAGRKTVFEVMPGVHRGRPRHSRSVPPAGTWGTAAIKSHNWEEKFVIYFPRHRLSKLDKLSRRRSLSRTHIQEMFSEKPRLFCEKPTGKYSFQKKCENCAQHTHHTKYCRARCGFCGSPSHKASSCKVKSSNRCKCQPFPQFHTAEDCYIRCSRVCGCPYHPGHFRHNNAMTCSYRCCMCGIKGHSGRKCSLKKCPCGERHLTQDCRWKVECPAKGCYYYLCSLHCRECGKKKDKETKDSFVGRTCQDCLKNGRPASAKV
ncbi:hypothetical protein F5B19DRAFT_466706 [Rostrohypoxylon terebratum]|nr:hypothetical protein F5B19DRAFT_466706 [Rostrohypoxylon terebratum]